MYVESIIRELKSAIQQIVTRLDSLTVQSNKIPTIEAQLAAYQQNIQQLIIDVAALKNEHTTTTTTTEVTTTTTTIM